MGYEIVDISKSPRGRAYNMFRNARMPAMVLTSKLDITPLMRLKKKGHSVNAMMLYCILKAGRQCDGCYYDIKDGELIKYDDMCIDMVVEGKDKGLYYMNIPYHDNYLDFEKDYARIKKQCYENNCSHKYDGVACLATSAVVNRRFESIVPNVSDDFMNPFFVWGRSDKKGLKDTLNVSLRVHHACLDGQEVGALFNGIQSEIDGLSKSIRRDTPTM